MEIKNLKQLIVYAGAVGISILLLFFCHYLHRNRL